jgi:hypothetical protein
MPTRQEVLAQMQAEREQSRQVKIADKQRTREVMAQEQLDQQQRLQEAGLIVIDPVTGNIQGE